MIRIAFLAVLLLSSPSSYAQVSLWKLGGSGLPWSENDSLNVLVDFTSAPNAIQPLYLRPEQNVLSLLDNWQLWRDPLARDQLGYVNGQKPRIWRAWRGSGGLPTYSGVYLVDADSSTYNVATSRGVNETFYTIDLAVPVPAKQFGFFTPPQGYRFDGTPLVVDATPAFDVSIGDDDEPAVNWVNRDLLQTVVDRRAENLAAAVRIDLPQQYTRYFRWRRLESILDADALAQCAECGGAQGNQALAVKGSIGGFEVFAEGVPQRAVYLSKIIDLGQPVNFGRLHWAVTPMRLVDGVAVEDPDAKVFVKVEVRTGRDAIPEIYHEFTNTGLESVISRERYQGLKLQRTREPKPGVRASILYDRENWTFWSVPFFASGQPLRLLHGSHIQLALTLESRDFSSWVRLDSLWIETSPLLADDIVGEVARADDMQPARGFTEVTLGETTEFAYDIRADFASAAEAGFDALRIHTGSRATFSGLQMGTPLVFVEPASIEEGENELVVYLPERVTRARNAPIRVVFGAEVFDLAAIFEGEVFSLQSDVLPQPIAPGDASEALTTNSLRVLSAAETVAAPVQDVVFSTSVLTPNGDGINDELRIGYTLFRLPESVPVLLEVYALDGRRVAQIDVGLQDSGPQSAVWNGRNEQGRALSPGLYLVSLVLQTESSISHPLRPLGIAY